MTIFKSFPFLGLILATQTASASLPGLEVAYDRLLSNTRARIISVKSGHEKVSKKCHSQTLDIRADGRIDITIAFGYMDVSGGQDVKDSGASLYGPGNVLDIDAKNALRGMLMSSCPSGNKLAACGFKANGDVLTKRIKDRWSKKRVPVTIRLAAPSVSASNSQNTGSLAGKQKQSSARVKNTFLSGLQNSDATLYLGHARSGGGPDFLPPVVYNNGNVNYSHYKNKQAGIGSMISALNGASEPSSVIGVLACKSTGLFSSRIRKAAADSLIVTADALFDYNDILPTGLAMVEAIVSQRCGDEFTGVTKVQPASKNFLKVFY